MPEINSVTGREVPHLTIAPEDRARLWAYLYPVVVLPGALSQHDWLEAAFCVMCAIGAGAVWRFGQVQEARTRTQKIVFTGLWVVAAGLVILPNSPHAARLAGLAITPVWFVADVCLARRGKMCGRTRVAAD